ncbi:MAG: SIR2 family protein [Candidatus Sphingomonas phytovorans]|nr:SIR2 family protein [Sphingomonas sp.]WEK00480.1 MAG: SIR2 family protein [Sphingomonas sp.]
MSETNSLQLSLPDDFRFEETVLFVGSGFSSLATAINGKRLPLGSQLDGRLAEALGLQPGKYDGKTLAEIANRRPEFDVDQFLSENLTVDVVDDQQIGVVNHPWYRIFTTNFDNCIEQILSGPNGSPDIYSFTDPLPNKIKPTSIIHLHGYIGRVTKSNAHTEIIYALKSYANLHSERPEWLTEFNRNLAQCRNVVFVGYSLGYDDHIRDIITKTTDISDKTFFFVGGEHDEIQNEVLGQYGKVSWSGTEGLSSFIKGAMGRGSATVDPNRLLAFDLFNPVRDKQAYSPTTYGEVQNLLAFGKFNRNRFYRDSGDGQYLIFRSKLIYEAEDVLRSGNSVLAHSYLGNGKTMFLETLCSKLQSEGWNCFILRNEALSILDEARFIDKMQKSVIVIDDYTVAREVVPALRRELANTLFVLTIRTGTLDYRMYEIGRVFGDRLATLDLNKITKPEFNKFQDWSRRAGVVSQNTDATFGRLLEIREIILDKFRNSKILTDRVEALVSAIKANHRAYNALIVLMIFRSIGESAQSDFIAFRVLSYDPQPELAKYQELWGEFKSRNDLSESVESGLFSEFVLSNFCEPDELMRVVEQIIAAIAPIRSDKTRFDAVFAKCLNFGALYRLCGADPSAIDAILAGYERLRHNRLVESEPLFWLQVAIANSARGQFRAAWTLINAAYERVNSEFEPYHIDTKALEVLFRLGADEREQFGTHEFEGLDRALESCASMVTKDRNRGDVLRALSYANAFFATRASEMHGAYKVRMAFFLASVSAHLRDLPPTMKARQGTEALKRSIDKSVAMLVSST